MVRTSDNFEGELVRLVGGPANIARVEACFTRLRLQLVRPEDVDTAEIEALAQVRAVFQTGDRLDVVVGPSAVESSRRIDGLASGA